MTDLLDTRTAAPLADGGWVDVLDVAQIPDERGVATLVGDDAVALFRVGQLVLAIDHREPFTGMPVLARGLLGSSDGRLFVSSPLHKQRFDLRTGECLDVHGVRLRTWRTRVSDGRVSVWTNS